MHSSEKSITFALSIRKDNIIQLKTLSAYRLAASRYMDKFDWFKNEFEYSLTKEEKVSLFNDFYDYVRVYDRSNPKAYSPDFMLDEIFQYDNIWSKYIDEDKYIDTLFEDLYDLKPDDMDSAIFYEIILNAEQHLDCEKDIKNEVIEKIKEMN